MTRFLSISIFFLALISGTSFTASASTNKSVSVTVIDTKETGSAPVSEPISNSKAIPQVPVTKTVPPLHPEEKGHTPKLEELPHIHHFHKERVKKVKRHHKKYWALSMVILVLCHISILVMAYMHVTPH
ncbi:MAG: hypothetical protein IPP43_02395 [Chitinophagaceae bacterium]|nr:hypothetical protein [Chitinophagaceae bacterium]